jgi:hypothetical protein
MVPNLAVLIIPAALFAGAAGPVCANPPSFDCNLAQTPDEVAICQDPELSALDVLGEMGFEYVARTQGKAQARSIGRPFLNARHACGSDVNCIGEVQGQAIAKWKSLGAPISPPEAASGVDDALPETLGACARSHIVGIEGRLSGDTSFESGTVVIFSNRGHQVSYDRETAIIGSRIGDPVSICLVHMPSNCPPGDDRGRVYVTTNQRTGGSWSLPDAEHECGGA